MPKIYKVVCLSGSTKFKDKFLQIASDLTMNGNIVLMPNVFGHTDNIEITTSKKEMLDDMHLRKINMSDELIVISVYGYIGESTRKEIDYAKTLSKPIKQYDFDNFNDMHITDWKEK